MRILSILWLGLACVLMSSAPARAQALSGSSSVSLPDATAFAVAIEKGALSVAREWLDAGLPPDFEGSRIGTGLMIGAWEGNIPMMELFLGRGADINKANALGEQALLHAAWKGHVTAVRWLSERGARLNREGKQWAALHYATFAGHEEVVRYLLERGADVNALSVNGSTPLMMAAREGKETIASRLLASGAKRDVANDWGDTAVTWAMRNNNVKIAREIATSTQFEAAVAARTAAPAPAIRSQALPDRIEMLLAQARKLEDAGMRSDALRLYRTALAGIRRVESKTSAVASSGAATRITITARRAQPENQTVRLNYATPAIGGQAERTGIAGVSNVSPVDDKIAPALKSASGISTPGGPPDLVDDWLRRARELEAVGRREDALSAYREASNALRRAR